MRSEEQEVLTCCRSIPRANETCQHTAEALHPQDTCASELTLMDLTNHLPSMRFQP